MPKREVLPATKRTAEQKAQQVARMKKLNKNELIDLVSDCEEFSEPFPPTSRLIPRHLQDAESQHLPEFGPPNPSMQGSNHFSCEICLMCGEKHFEAGRYMLDCTHSFCNDCICYWESVSERCPVCNKKTTSVLGVLEGHSRVRKVNFTPYVPRCTRCSQNNNYHLMYFCDQCNDSCIHTYCDPSLKEESEQERWVCDHCIYSNYYENKYNEESASEHVQEVEDGYEIDSFVVPNDVEHPEEEGKCSLGSGGPARLGQNGRKGKGKGSRRR